MSTTVFGTDPTVSRGRPGSPRLGLEPRRGDEQMMRMQQVTDDDDDKSDDDAYTLSLSPPLSLALSPGME